MAYQATQDRAIGVLQPHEPSGMIWIAALGVGAFVIAFEFFLDRMKRIGWRLHHNRRKGS